MNDALTINGNPIPPALFTLMRQVVLALSGYAFGKGALESDVVEAVAWVLVFGGTLAYGQIRGWLERKKLVTLAHVAPDSVAVVK